MNNVENTSPQTFVGHVHNGVVVFHSATNLPEGQPVRVEPIEAPSVDRTARLRELEQMFAEWNEEDARLSDEDADCLHRALQENRGLQLHEPKLT